MTKNRARGMSRTSNRALYKDVREEELQEQVYTLLHLNGWKVAHFRTSMNAGGRYQTAVQYDAGGFPDLFCVHPPTGDQLALELKTEYAPASPEQLQWLAWFEACGVDAMLVRPSMIDEVITRCRKARQ